MKKKFIYTLSIITIITAIAGLTIVVSLNKSDGEASAQTTIAAGETYQIYLPQANTINSVQPAISVNKTIRLNGTVEIYIPNRMLRVTWEYVYIFVQPNGQQFYTFGQTSSASTAPSRVTIFMDGMGNKTQSISYYINNVEHNSKQENWGNDIPEFKFNSIVPRTSLTTDETTAFNNFLADMYNIQYHPQTYLTINAGNYTLNPNILLNLNSDESIQLNHNLLYPDLTSFNPTSTATITLNELSGTRTAISWSTSGLYPNRLLSGEQDIYTRINGGTPTLHSYIIKVETQQVVTENTISQALTPLPENTTLQYYFYDFAQQYNAAYNAGYDEAINNNIISDNTTGVISALFSGLFGSIFAVEIFPGFPLYIFILIPVVFAVIGLVFWLVRGR